MRTQNAPKSITLLDTYNQFGLTEEDWLEYLSEEVDHDQYLAWIKDHNFTEEEFPFTKYCLEYEHVQKMDDWITDMCCMYTHDFWSNNTGALDEEPIGFVITGTLGLWNGRPSVGKICLNDNIFATLRKCYGNDIYDLQITWEDGVVVVNAMHHDGTNRLEVRSLSAKGVKWAEKHADYSVEDCQFLADTKGYTKKIKVF